MCRRASGSSFATNASVRKENFRILDGGELMKEYESSPGSRRAFCSNCGSPLYKTFADIPELLSKVVDLMLAWKRRRTLLREQTQPPGGSRVGRETPPMLKVIEKRHGREAGEELFVLDEIAREGARRMLIEALKAEVDDYVERHRSVRDEQGHALVVRNGHAQTRKVTLGAGTVELNAPRVNDRRLDDSGRRRRFTSHILPPYMRRSPKVAEVLPILYLRGLSTGDFRPALQAARDGPAALAAVGWRRSPATGPCRCEVHW
jgi:hypothetical protein